MTRIRSRVTGADVAALLAETMNVEVPAVDADLIATGTLDSLALVELILHLESRYGVGITLDDLDLDVFRSVAYIAEFVNDLRQIALSA